MTDPILQRAGETYLEHLLSEGRSERRPAAATQG
jgi:hypothetical protein